MILKDHLRSKANDSVRWLIYDALLIFYSKYASTLCFSVCET